MLLCFYAHPVRSGVVWEDLSEKGDRLVWNGEDNALCLSLVSVRCPHESQVGVTPLCRLWGLFIARCPGNGRSSCGVRSCFARVALW